MPGNAASRVRILHLFQRAPMSTAAIPTSMALFLQQAGERDPKKREAILDKDPAADDRSRDVRAGLRLRRPDGGPARASAKDTINDIYLDPFPPTRISS